MTPGGLTLYLATALGVVAFVSAIRWARGNEGAESTFRWAYHGMTALLAAACVFLMIAILTHDFRFHYVIGYSSRDLPLLYLVSAFWGGQQGTFLLWAFLGALIGYPLFRRRSWEPAAVMACYVPTILFQLILMLDPGGNPFRLAETVPPDGRGLNPLLQDPWMASHPPMVFVGYAAMTVPAALALVALFKREEMRWLDTAIRWSLIGFLSLGGGIILGGFWAYKVLGWGGYWGWDPVENASLVPWIVVTALLHGLLVQRATGALRRTNLVLALSCFALVLYATFLTRSGVLADFSVHSFPKGSLYRVLVGVMVVTLGVSAFALIRRRNENGKPIPWNAGWSFLLSLALWLFVISAVAVLVGTSMPILSSAAMKLPALSKFVTNPITPDVRFYNTSNLPLYLVLLGLLGVAPFSSWRKESWRQWGRLVLLSVGLALVGTVVAYAAGGRGIRFLALMLVALFALSSNIVRLVQVARVRMLHTGAAIAHIGFALMFVGIVASSAWDREQEVRLPLGEPVHALDRILTYRGHVAGSEPKDQWRVEVMEPGGVERMGMTTMYQVADGSQEGSLMRNPAILRSASYDLYVAPLGLETGRHTLDLVENQPVPYHDATLTFTGFRMDAEAAAEGHARVYARVRIENEGSEPEEVDLALSSIAGRLQADPVRPDSLGGATLMLQRMAVEQRLVRVLASDGGASETLVVTAAVKPLMNVLWAGTIVMLLGCSVAVVRRYVESRAFADAASPVTEPAGRRSAATLATRRRRTV